MSQLVSDAMGLLPSGLHDHLAPQAEREMQALNRTMQCFVQFGYQQVNPPLLEFEDTLLSGRGASLGGETFRLTDPATGKMLALRADMTMQIARIATHRMADATHPLRLCYAGQVVRRNGHPLRQKRQFRQAGIELIGRGALPLAADWEVMRVAVLAVQNLGITDLSLDLNMPDLLPTLLAECGLDSATQKDLMQALAQKDTTVLAKSGLNADLQKLLKALVEAAGTVAHALPRLQALAAAHPQISAFKDVLETLAVLPDLLPNVALTVDPVEARGFEYHHRLSYCLFSAHSQQELGRGGRYEIAKGQEAAGLTLYVDTLNELLPVEAPRPTVLVPLNAAPDILEKLHAQNYATVLDNGTQTPTTHRLDGKKIIEITSKK